MSKFKVGQRVRVVVDDSVIGLGTTPRQHSVGVVVDFEDDYVGVKFEGYDRVDPYLYYEDNELEAVE